VRSALIVLAVALGIGSVSMMASLALGSAHASRTGAHIRPAPPDDADENADDTLDNGGGSAEGPPPITAPPTAIPTASPKPTGNAAMEAAVLTLVNQERAKVSGCKPLVADSRLTTAARAHSADMAANNYFDHTTPSGVEFGTRIKRAGYRFSTAGENIAMGQRTPAEVMKSWMNSDGHRRNILNCAYRNLGVGLAYGAKRAPYWTQDFAAP
jgi:uncharacterized protein YkwD